MRKKVARKLSQVQKECIHSKTKEKVEGRSTKDYDHAKDPQTVCIFLWLKGGVRKAGLTKIWGGNSPPIANEERGRNYPEKLKSQA